MKRMNIYLKSKQMDNRGLSLIEILMAIAILAIIIVPVFGSFITAARVNRDARRVMAATNTAQTILEGFADKSYEDVKTAIGLMGTVDLSGNYALSTLDGNYYNMASSYEALNPGPFYGASIGVSGPDEVIYLGDFYRAVDLISGNGVSANTVSFNNIASMAAALNVSSGADKALMSWTDASGLFTALVYSGIEVEYFKFDVIVTFIPMAAAPTDRYYTYCTTLTVYDANPEDPSKRFQQSELLDIMLGGIAK